MSEIAPIINKASFFSKVQLDERGIAKYSLDEKVIHVSTGNDDIVCLTYRHNDDYNIFKLDKKGCKHLINILTNAYNSITP